MSDHSSDDDDDDQSRNRISSSSSSTAFASKSKPSKKKLSTRKMSDREKEQQVGLLAEEDDADDRKETTAQTTRLVAPTSAVTVSTCSDDVDRPLGLSPRPSPPSTSSSVPFAKLSGGDSPESAATNSTVQEKTKARMIHIAPVSTISPQRHPLAHELVDSHHPLPASSPPAFIQMPSPSPSPPPASSRHRLNGASSPNSIAEQHSQWNIWKERGRELLSWATWLYYIRHAYREMKKRKCNYALGIFSCFLVVVVAAVCYTLIARAPVVFLQQAESSVGQIDLQLTPSQMNSMYLNYTTLIHNIGDDSAEYALHTARAQYDVHVLPARSCEFGDPFIPDWKYIGFDNDTSFTCTNTTQSCIETICTFSSLAQREDVPLWVIDSGRESTMGLGRLWPYPADELGAGEAIITIDLATQWQISVGDVINVRLGHGGSNGRTAPFGIVFTAGVAKGLSWSLEGMDGNSTAILNQFLSQYISIVYAPFTVKHIIEKTYGKFLTDTNPLIVIEQKYFLPYLFQHLHPVLRMTTSLNDMVSLLESPGPLVTAFQNTPFKTLSAPLSTYPQLYPSQLLSMDSFARFVYFNLPNNRVEIYMDTNFDNIQAALINWSSFILYKGGFTQLESSMPILDELSKVKMFSLYLGLILSIILTILFLLSMLLIYSLLMISIESRTFELGVHRMCGMNRWNIVKLLIVQALSFSIPAWVIGLVSSQIIIAIVIGNLERSVEIPLNKLLTQQSIGVASVMGLILPLLASILPIRTALSKNLQDALDTRHSKTAGVEFSIERSVDAGIDSAWLVLGIGMTVLGGSIYYLVPLALLSFNLALFFNIFFALLLGMLLGLILLSLNFQPLLERAIVFVSLWWESRSITFLVLKNLITHRVRNRKTSIMFALSLGFILFITVAFQLELYSAKARMYKQWGSEMIVYTPFTNSFIYPKEIVSLEDILAKYSVDSNPSNPIRGWSWVTGRLKTGGEWDDTFFSNLGHAYGQEVEIYGISSNFYDTTLNEYLVYDSNTPSETATQPSEQLYSATGSQSAILGTSNKQQFGMANTNGMETSFLYALQQRATEDSAASLEFHRLRPLTFLDLSPKFNLGRFSSIRAQPTMVSLATFMRLSNGHYQRIRDIPMSTCLIHFTDSATNGQKDAVSNDLTNFVKSTNRRLWDQRKVSGQLDRSNSVMTLIFSIATYIAMFLCLFSLVASMLTNIYEQSKEISVLRSIGQTKRGIIKIYTYESFVLVMSSSMLGIMIGLIMSGTMISQRILFTQLPVPFLFPWSILIYTFTGSIICALISSTFPAKKLMERSIASIMKSVL